MNSEYLEYLEHWLYDDDDDDGGGALTLTRRASTATNDVSVTAFADIMNKNGIFNIARFFSPSSFVIHEFARGRPMNIANKTKTFSIEMK